MTGERLTVAIPSRTILLPIEWVLQSGWLPSDPRVLSVDTDQAAARALEQNEAVVALVDPLYWARRRGELRPVVRTAVSLGPDGTDLVLLSAVRLDGLEQVTAPESLAGTSAEAVARTLVRDYYGVEAPLRLTQTGRVGGEEGRIVADTDALSPQPYEFVENLSRAWWVMSGTPWVRALPVQSNTAPVDAQVESLFKEIARLLSQQSETVAHALAGSHGGSEEKWLDLVTALRLSYGAEERKSLSEVLRRASRLRLSPTVDDSALPRY